MNINNWMVQNEKYIKTFDSSKWVALTVNNKDNEIVATFPDLNEWYDDDIQGYNKLKAYLLETYRQMSISYTWTDLMERDQECGETAEHYGHALMKMATKVFPDIKKKEIEDTIHT